MINWLIGVVIFASAFLLVKRSIRISRQGRCAGCAWEQGCHHKCDPMTDGTDARRGAG